MSRKNRIIEYVRSTLDGSFDAERHELGPMLDSVSLLQLIAFIEQELGIALDLPSLRLDMFLSVESLVRTLDSYDPEPIEAKGLLR